MLRLRRLRGYAQHERKFLNLFAATPFALSGAKSKGANFRNTR